MTCCSILCRVNQNVVIVLTISSPSNCDSSGTLQLPGVTPNSGAATSRKLFAVAVVEMVIMCYAL